MRSRYWLIYVLLVIAQIILSNFLNLGQYVAICILPVLILSIPIKYSTISTMVIAFLTGLAADLLTHGILGLSSLALVPVAFSKRWMVSVTMGEEVLSRGENISKAKQGLGKLALITLFATAMYFAIFVWVDAAGTRNFGFNTIRWVLSSIASSVAQIFLTGLLGGEEDSRWK